jgi:hypothetical protein
LEFLDRNEASSPGVLKSAAYGKWSRDIPGHIKKADAIWKERFRK